MPPTMEEVLRQVEETNEAVSGYLASLNTAPQAPRVDVARGVPDQGSQIQTRSVMNMEDRYAVQERLKKLSTPQLMRLFAMQSVKRDSGVGLYDWLNSGGYATQEKFTGAGGIASQVSPEVAKAIDSGGAAALIRQDLEPVLLEIYVRLFPFYDRIAKEPANGLVHAYNQITDFGDAQFMAELGTVTDDQNTYVRKTTNVAILATRRGVSLKSQFAVIAGGMNYNPEQLELSGGMRAMAHAMQRQIFSGQATVTGHGDYTDEYGKYDANAFDGLRYLLGIVQNNGRNVDPATNPTTAGNLRRAIDAAIIQPLQTGLTTNLEIWSYPIEKQTWDEQQDANVRILEASQRNAQVGVVANAVNTILGPIPWNIVPGDSIDPTVAASGYNPGAHYSGATTVRDIYALDSASLSMPYLGTEGPTVLDIPIGISGQLTRLFVIFDMKGLALKAPSWANKLRVKLT